MNISRLLIEYQLNKGDGAARSFTRVSLFASRILPGDGDMTKPEKSPPSENWCQLRPFPARIFVRWYEAYRQRSANRRRTDVHVHGYWSILTFVVTEVLNAPQLGPSCKERLSHGWSTGESQGIRKFNDNADVEESKISAARQLVRDTP